ncbi:L-seryl-tRNA(Sec) selenium transferase [candidate division KSB1 bacterium]|nr:L-seryl-tRNA(Sec) selenium transferase [candidate division KSB1 bacterium]
MPHSKDLKRVDMLKSLPSIESILSSEVAGVFLAKIHRELLTTLARESVDEARNAVLNEKRAPKNPDQVVDDVYRIFEAKCQQLLRPSLRRVINCTGVILHTGLGRAVLSEVATKPVQELMSGYMNLELNLDDGKRGDRTSHVEELLCRLTGAEAACVVNNNAAAVLIALNSLANRKEVVISRGELVEIGGSFRIPDVMKKSGTKMVEVGTTNKTHKRDFVDAISERTAGFLHVHTSNYRVQGFTAQVSLAELVSVAHEHGLFVLHDLGGGILTDLRDFGLPHEPVVRESVTGGADVITFSGDKMLGGPQAGIIVGKKNLISKIKRNPLMRALRCDKLTYLILENTLRLFLHPKQLHSQHAVVGMLSMQVEHILKRAKDVLDAIVKKSRRFDVAIEKSTASAGSGALPLEKLPSYALAIRAKDGKIEKLARQLRLSEPAVLGYLQKETLYLDLRTVLPSDLEELKRILGGCLSS